MPKQLNGEKARANMMQQGTTLLEVLIALLVLSTGLLGLAALQTTALRHSQVADMHQRAAQLVNDIGEQIRANPAAGLQGEYTLFRGQLPTTTAATAAADLQAWLAQVNTLPAASAEILPCAMHAGLTCPAGGQLVTVYWNAARDPAVQHYHCPPRSKTDFNCFRQMIR